MPDGRGPERLGDILRRVLRHRGLGDRARLAAIGGVVAETIGPDRAPGVRVRALQRGVLTLGVRSSSLRLEVEGFYGESLLEGIRAVPAGRGVERIRFLVEG